MKKLFVCLMALLCITLCGCSGYEKGKTFSNEFLKLASLENIPLPKYEEYSLNDNTQNHEYLKAKMSRSDFNSYVESFVKYMIARNDIYYFELQKSDGLIAEMFPHRVVYQVDESFKCDNDKNWYAFSYSLSDDTSDYSSCEHVIYEEFICVTMEYDKEKCIAEIDIDLDPTFGGCIDESLIEYKN